MQRFWHPDLVADRPTPTVLARWFLISLLLFGHALAQANVPQKSPNDPNSYRALTLENGLRVLLVSDPKADKAAAALDVAVGSGDDPKDRHGLAHFLEHMLFLGTRKYPQPGEYQAFISRHGGNHNAMTTHDHTNYFFDIDPAYLEPALDRFAQQFVAPLFNPEFVDRERHAVHSEFSASLREDGRRFHSAFKDIINPQHDYNTFAVGNLDTLADRPDDSVHAALLAFYAQHYSAQRMTLVVMGPQPLNVLEGWVKARFADIPGQPVDAQRPQASLFTDGTLPALLEVNAIKDVRSLRLSFPLPPQRSAYRTKPYAYVAHLIGHEGPGSILQVLKDAGLAEGLSAGLGLDLARESLLDIGISLTPQGLERWEDVVAVVFAGIEQIRREGIQETYFREEQRLMDIGLRFQERASPIHLVSALAMRLHEVPVEDVLVAPWLMSDYTPEAYRAILDRLTPDNLLVSLMTPGRVSADATDTRRSPWYQTHYRLSALDPNRVQAGTSSDAGVQALIARLALPAPNPFIPERLDLLGGPRMKTPERLIDDPGFTLWFAQDTEFGAPRANVYISFRSPESNRTARDAVLTRLWLDSVTDQLNALVYPAQLAGLDYAIYPHLRGLTLRVSGYNDKLDVLLREVLMAVRQTRFDPARFAQHRQALEEQLLNRRKQKPYEQAMRIAQESLLPGSWPLEARLDAVRAVGLADVQDMAQRFSRQLDTVVMAHGNLDRTATLNLATQIRALVKGEPTLVKRPVLRHLKPGQTESLTLDVEHADTGYLRYLQGRDTSFAEQARFLMLAQVLSAPFYEQLRTQEQLGYIVFATNYEMLEHPALALILQSPGAQADTLQTRVDAFLQGFADTLASQPPSVFAQHQAGVLSQLRQREQRLDSRSERFWQEIDRENAAFNTRTQLIRAVTALTPDEVLEAYRDRVLGNPATLLATTRSIAIEPAAPASEAAPPAAASIVGNE